MVDYMEDTVGSLVVCTDDFGVKVDVDRRRNELLLNLDSSV